MAGAVELMKSVKVYPLQARLRKTLSERRRSQWAEREGRQHPPTGPDDQS